MTSATVRSPFGFPSHECLVLDSAFIAEGYQRKCGLDVTEWLSKAHELTLYECSGTGYRFWRPVEVLGDDAFYARLAASWPNYYQTRRWEFPLARKAIARGAKVLEIGSGRGQFLKLMEGHASHAQGIDFNKAAIAQKETRFPIDCIAIEDVASTGQVFDAVCAFQVLEHVADPSRLLKTAIETLAPGGVLVLSTPNSNYVPHARHEDPFDLPPHHIGAFSSASFRRIADTLGLEVAAIVEEPRRACVEPVTSATARRLVYRLARAAALRLLTGAYAIGREPGPSVFVVLRRR